ncbi:MAG: small, acid-soluble spore protein, alpha/beta type [Clostridia bacterium]|jgi:small acid-soluble spore protein F (minor alpha/beta-type SASP)|nr:small, acid-soluble spore protein, alpha/beta type [Clostridiaceae bacterium]
MKKKKEDRSSMKYKVAQELGLLEKVEKSGWDSLTAKESGRIGGIISRRFKG